MSKFTQYMARDRDNVAREGSPSYRAVSESREREREKAEAQACLGKEDEPKKWGGSDCLRRKEVRRRG